jgi:hypothetical protein
MPPTAAGISTEVLVPVPLATPSGSTHRVLALWCSQAVVNNSQLSWQPQRQWQDVSDMPSALETRCVVCGAWCMVRMVRGARCMVHGAWCMVRGAW